MSHAIPEVLIVDDQPRNLDALEAMLSPLGCAFVRAIGGRGVALPPASQLRRYRSRHPDARDERHRAGDADQAAERLGVRENEERLRMAMEVARIAAWSGALLRDR
jgi:CheY-like chemotaxis protein